MSCQHKEVICLNQYELIRKYSCQECNEVMMCSCDKSHGEKHLPHQLKVGCVLETQDRVPVTLGFQENICNECKGLPLENAPVASAPGRTSQLHRYYWREIAFQTTEKFYEKHSHLQEKEGSSSEFDYEQLRKPIEKEVIKNLKELHSSNPKYIYNNLISEPELLEKYCIKKIEVKANHRHVEDDNRVRFDYEGDLLTVEEFALKYYEELGLSGLETESIPFHVIFAAYMAPFIQDTQDEKCRLVQFGSRTNFDLDVESQLINTYLPSDFGTKGYYERRGELLENYIASLDIDKDTYYNFIFHSIEFREYLWAHRPKDIELAHKIVSIIGDKGIKSILSYLSREYWYNFCGWPDLLLFNKGTIKFVEVKSSNDKLSDDQKNWIKGNFEYLNFSFELFKVCKQ